LVCALLAWPLSMAHASPNGKLAGRITDEHGRPLAGATLKLTGPGTAGLLKITSDTAGFYQFQGIPTRESLDLRAEAPGKSPLIFTGLRARESIAARLDIRLRPPDWKVILAVLDPGTPYHRVALSGAASTIAGEVRALEISGHARADGTALREALRDRPNAVLAIGSAAAMLARRETQDLPVIYTMALDPTGEGLETANLCGAPLNGAFGDQLAVLAALRESTLRVATIFDPRRLDADVRELEKAARARGMSLTALPARSVRQVRGCLRALSRDRHDAFLLLMDPALIDQATFEEIRRFAAQSGMILIVPDASLVGAGATFAYGPGYRELGAYAGRVINNILRGAATAAALGRIYPTTRYLAIDTSQARRLGLTLPGGISSWENLSGQAGQVMDLPGAQVEDPHDSDLDQPERPR
jgi:ABC-type uncharacterized transport system substrate-binding protein